MEISDIMATSKIPLDKPALIVNFVANNRSQYINMGSDERLCEANDLMTLAVKEKIIAVEIEGSQTGCDTATLSVIMAKVESWECLYTEKDKGE